MIELETFTKTQLKVLVESERFSQFSFLPITQHRALSHCNNPKANNDDVLLILAIENQELAGYLGILPDEIICQNGKEKLVWLSTIYVDSRFRGKKIAQQLLAKAFECYDGRIALTEFTAEAERLYNKTGQFLYICPKLGKRYYFLSNLEELLPQKFQTFQSFESVLKILDSSFNFIVKTLSNKQKKLNFRYEIHHEIDEESTEYIRMFSCNRNAQDLHWILHYPWILQGEEVLKKYQFSSFAKKKKTIWVKIYDEQEKLNCCAMLSSRNGHLKIPYLFGKDLKNFIQFLSYFIRTERVKMLTCYHPQLNEELKDFGINALYSKDFERRYLFHKKIIAALPKGFIPQFQDGDGDCAFT